MGFLVSQHGQLGAIPPPPFLSISPLKIIRSGATPPHKKGYLSDIGAIPDENKAKWVRYPALRYYLEKVLSDRGVGGILHWPAKRSKKSETARRQQK